MTLEIGADGAGLRLDRALAIAAGDIPGLSRSRLAQLIAAGAVIGPDGSPAREPRRKPAAGERFTVHLPPPAPAEPQPEAIPLAILHEDADLVVVDKPAGMVVHPAPGAETGTLVNALLAHCGDSLAGIGGTARPGIVHRIDKETSGLLVVAKTQAAHEGLARQFAAHSTQRRYLAVLRGAPGREEPRLAGLPGLSFSAEGIRIETQIARHTHDRQRMAVVRGGGRRAVTHLRVLERYGPAGAAPLASLAECRLETGRTHQIRVHAAHIGHALIGDPVYGRPKPLPKETPEALAAALAGFGRQALHAAALGFEHPVTGAALAFEAPPPADMQALLDILRRNRAGLR
ncbi:RluA family pseudouridine synthase [Paralimibaculum aggregatum]|uniref:Pseudouridine synthase n=1 Tax=Paralimibaculum aggregatum TaxID=3036245 RepID=A0ABQ6LN02_9RHOB|nr:RluA family pseudouridine synthase [Limibaculum sp. NKW23]